MRYEFEVGDYVKIIANASNSKHPIGYVGKVLKSENFPKAKMPGLWYVIEEKEGGTYSHGSELVIATKAEYESYHKPEYVECIHNKGALSDQLILGKIYKVDLIKSTNDDLWLIGFGTRIYRGLNPPATTNYNGYSGFKSSTKEAFDAQNKPKAKFKVGDKVKLLTDKVSKSFYTEALHYSNRLLQDSNSVFIVEAITSNGVPQWNNQFIRVKGYDYEHPIDCFELYTEPQFRVGDWVYFTGKGNSIVTSTWHIGKVGKIAIIESGHLEDNINLGWCANYISGFRLATEAEIKSHLLKEAERRGFKPGVSYKMNDSVNTAVANVDFFVNMNSKYNLHCGYGCGLIYNDSTGKWATIVPQDKELCGHKVVKPEGSSIISIGCKSISRGEIQGFLNVCEKFDITRIQSSYVKDTITLQDIKEALK
jgi:hypothetical protein